MIDASALPGPRSLWAKVDFDGPVPTCRPDLGPCWLWTAATNGKSGYGIFGGRTGLTDKTRLAHRIIHQLLIGPIPEGMTRDHLCRVRLCVNPAHGEIVTLAENSLRGESPMAHKARQTHCDRGHPFDQANTRINRRGRRECRACDREDAMVRSGGPRPRVHPVPEHGTMARYSSGCRCETCSHAHSLFRRLYYTLGVPAADARVLATEAGHLRRLQLVVA